MFANDICHSIICGSDRNDQTCEFELSLSKVDDFGERSLFRSVASEINFPRGWEKIGRYLVKSSIS